MINDPAFVANFSGCQDVQLQRGRSERVCRCVCVLCRYVDEVEGIVQKVLSPFVKTPYLRTIEVDGI